MQVPFLYRIIHAKHHTKAVMRACEAVRVSAIEQALDVTCSILALKVSRPNVLTLVLCCCCSWNAPPLVTPPHSATMVALAQIVGGHPLSRMVYNIVIVYLITELHCGYDLPWMLANVVPFGVWTGSR